jgi:predicted O-linked N-acetylglucosamine transferase (SPINDLY family)
MSSDAVKEPTPPLDRAFDLYEGGDANGAAEVCRSILSAEDDNYGATYLLGAILGEQKRFDASISLLKKAIAIAPAKPIAHYNLATVLHRAERYRDALAAIDSYLALVANDAEAYVLRAAVCFKLGRLADSLSSADRAVELKPQLAEAHNDRGNALGGLKRFVEAVASYDKAIARKPDFAGAHRNRGGALNELRRFDEALRSYDRAIALQPDFGQAYLGKGAVLSELKQLEGALVCLERARALAVETDFLAGEIFSTRQKLCDWEAYAERTASLKSQIEDLKAATMPFTALSMSNSAALDRRAAEIFVATTLKDLDPPTVIERRPRRDKIRIGYFSADFRNHPVAMVMAGVFERHDRREYEVTAFSFGPESGDDMRKRLIVAFDRLVDTSGQADLQVVDLARRLEIDIAIDLSGFTAGNRVEIFARRAAPIQVNFLGYPATMAAPFIDYIIGDKVVAPERSRSDYSEKIAYLPDSFFPYDRSMKIADRVYGRDEFALPRQRFVYCCFNNSYKITPDVFDCWMRILKRASDSVLWLIGDNRAVVANLRKEARARGVDPDRLAFAERLPVAEYLARYRVADLFLDTRPYNAITTASDALWAGLPVLTWIGETFAGRGAASLLTAIGLPELIAQSQAEYEALAVELATNPEKLAAIKDRLAKNRLTTPLFDTERYTRNLEAAYQAMYDRHHADLPPDHVFIEA